METSTGKTTARRFLKKITWIGLALLIVIAGFAVYTRTLMVPEPIQDIFGILESQGYTSNTGFSGAFNPGTVVQTIESGPDGQERELPTPVVFLWSSDCFPDMTPRISPFVLPQTRGTSSASLTIGADALTKLFPLLQVDSSAIVDYSLKIENPQVYTFAKGDLSGQFSEKCVQAYDQQIEAGDKPEWFALILDAIVAEKLAFEMGWKANTSAEARAAATKEAGDALSRVLGATSPGENTPGASVNLESEDEKHTVIAAEGHIVVGYRARPMQRQR
jgi:hypothetical protein